MSGPDVSRPDLSRVDTWLFDLDDTLYPAETALMDLIRDRITQFVMTITGEDWDGARAIQRGWFEEHGAALPGLLAAHEVSARDFLDYVHDVPLDRIQPDPALDAALARLPGRRLVFTNGSADHARRILDRLGIASRFDDIFHIESANLIPKPAPVTFDRMMALHQVRPRSTAFFEDSERNLEHAAHLGMITVLVGPHAAASEAGYIHYRTASLVAFLQGLSFA
jgi:putative hydrolase of the HAD superfamily